MKHDLERKSRQACKGHSGACTTQSRLHLAPVVVPNHELFNCGNPLPTAAAVQQRMTLVTLTANTRSRPQQFETAEAHKDATCSRNARRDAATNAAPHQCLRQGVQRKWNHSPLVAPHQVSIAIMATKWLSTESLSFVHNFYFTSFARQ